MRSAPRFRTMMVALALLALAGCQSLPGASQGLQGDVSGTVASPGDRVAHAGPRRVITADREAQELRVFLADTRPHAGWAPVHLKPSGILYVRTDALIDRSDLIGIQSATDQSGGGILVLILGDSGFRKLRQATVAHPGLRLALVVGQIMLAAPAYAAPIRERQLAFSVGSASNAEQAARSVAGVQ